MLIPSVLPHPTRLRSMATAVVASLLLTAGCGPPEAAEPTRRPDAPADTLASVPLHSRELLFVGERAEVPLVVSFHFVTAAQAEGLRRDVRAWLAQGAQWERFLDQSADSPSAAGGPWRIVPHGNLRVIAGGPHEVEALVYRSGDRALRMQPAILRATWPVREDLQYRLYEGQLEVGGLPSRGAVLEAYRVVRGDADFHMGAGAVDWLFVTDGRDLQMVVSESLTPDASPDKTFAWMVRPEAEQTWSQAEVRWLEMTAVEAARRDVPVSWSVRVPGGGISGELHSIGFDVQVGADRPGRRAVLLRHTVEGWIGVGADRVRVFGYLRHSQE